MKLEDLTGDDRTLVVAALQALYRERANSYNSAWTACQLAGKKPPEETHFGVEESISAIRRIGALPQR
ncbi:hypothetical protein [Klebsiella pneumoniae]|uniref:hypothetical protein n=1 Tax=Klebsiella pneumoniae TaxID=573 RepID=UPI002AA48A74|nr:hypothetical protein [Klebsiella pneumoniae]